MIKKEQLIFLLIYCIVSVSFGQQPLFKHYKTENGLSHNTVFSSLKDSRGFMWFGTKSGLNRFDGVTFKTFQHKATDSKSLGGDYVMCLHEFKNQLWIGTDAGLYRFNDMLEEFEIIPITLNNNILDIENDNEGNLWFISGNLLYKYNPTSREVTNINTNFSAKYLAQSIDGSIWASQNSSLYHYSKENNSFNRIKIDLTTIDNKPLKISKLVVLSSNEILIGTQNNGVILYTISTNSFKKILPDSNSPIFVRDILVKDQYELWIATETGLHIYNLLDNSYLNYKKNFGDPFAISDNALYSLAEDNEGGVWIGTYFSGLNYCPKQYTPFNRYYPKVNENSISGLAVREIHSDNYGNLWIGTEDAGLNKFEPRTGKFSHFKPSSKENTLSHYNIHGILPRKDKLWVGTFYKGIDLIDLKTEQIVKHIDTKMNNGLLNDFVFDLYETTDKQILALTPSGMFVYNDLKDLFTSFEGFPEGLNYTTIFETTENILLAGSYWDGLFYYDPKTRRKINFRYDKQNTNSISNNTINGIFEDSHNNIWITTEYGLNLFDINRKEFKTFTTENGFPSNKFYSIIESDNTLWISTSKGLTAFNPTTNNIKTYTTSDGLLSDQFNYNSSYKDNQGTIYFGSVQGMISFNPKNFENNEYEPPIYITDLQLNNEPICNNSDDPLYSKSISYLDEITINPEITSISIDFAALSYTAPETIDYSYKLEGLDNKWISIGKTHQVSFTGLTSGNYTFSVKSHKTDGSLSKNMASLKIKILPPFWRSNLAYLLYFILSALLIFVVARFYHLRINAKNKLIISTLNNLKEKELYQAKIEFFTNVSHEIRTPLTLIKIPLENLLKASKIEPQIKESLIIINENTNRLLNLVNQLLDFRKTELQNVSLSFIEVNISELIRTTLKRFSLSVKNKNINIQTNLGEKDVCAYVDLEALKKILSNLINNAIKYSDDLIIINVLINDTDFEIIIKNNGILIPPHLKSKIFEPFFRMDQLDEKDNLGTGIGLPLAHSLVTLHNGSLYLDTSDSSLNSFVLKMPLHQQNEYQISKPITPVSNFEDDYEENVEIDKDYKPKILIVEDNTDLLELIAKELSVDFKIVKTTNAKKALKKLNDISVQIIISDVMMPGLSGFEFCKKIKTNIETSHIPVILLTAKSGSGSKIEGLESGADSYIEKPFSMEYLKVTIMNLLDNRKHIMNHYSSSPLAHVKSIVHTKLDDTFINKLDNYILSHISDPTLNVDSLAENMNMSRATLYRKIKNISNLTPSELINISRLKKAAELLKTVDYKIYEVAELVGYNSVSSFGRSFQKQFGITPSEYSNNSYYKNQKESL